MMGFPIGAESSLSLCSCRLRSKGTAVPSIKTLSSGSSPSFSSIFQFPSAVCDGSARKTQALSSCLSASSPTLAVRESFTNMEGKPRLSIRSQALPKSDKGGRPSKRIWRRRKLAKKDPMSFKLERVPFLEETMRKITDSGEIISGDIERLLRLEDNRYQFVNDVAAEAKAYVESNRDEYGHKKAIHHVLTNRMNDYGFSRPEAYLMPDPFKPGPGYLKEEDW